MPRKLINRKGNNTNPEDSAAVSGAGGAPPASTIERRNPQLILLERGISGAGTASESVRQSPQYVLNRNRCLPKVFPPLTDMLSARTD